MTGVSVMEKETLDICPLCRYPIGPDVRCTNPTCGTPLDKGDWSLSAVYSTEGLLPPESGKGPFRLPDSAVLCSGQKGKLLSLLPPKLDPLDGTYDIGDSMSCHIRIAGAASPRQVSLHIHRRTCDWWAFNWCNGPDATINDESFRNRQLKDDDILCVAGVKLRYRSGRIAVEYGTTDGVDVVVSNLTDTRMSFEDPSRPLLDRVSFVAKGGEFVGIIGPSGCGKSTLIKTIAGLVEPASGCRVTFNGVSRSEDAALIRACTAYLPQSVDVTLHDELTLSQEIRAYSVVHNIQRDESREQNLLCELKLTADSRIGAMSGGQRRRAAFLLALLRDPSVLLLDEPTAGLDRATETDLMEDLRRMARSGARKTILCATHELANIGLFDRILVMTKGQLVYNKGRDEVSGKLEEDVFETLCIPAEGDERFKQLYKSLEDIEHNSAIKEGIRQNHNEEPQPQHPTPPVPPNKTGGWLGCLSGYLIRSWLSFASFTQKPFVKWLFSLPITLFVWQPLIVALCLCIALKEKYGDDVTTVFFCAAIAAFWLGMSGAVRSLVSNRPGRCLERIEGVPRSAYLSAVLSSSLVRGLLQGIFLTAFLYLIPNLYDFTAKWNTTPRAFLGIGTCLVAVEWMGGFVGMALSALAPSETFAVTMVPNLAVVALFFSEPLMGAEGANLLAKVLPAHAAHRTMLAFHDPNQKYANWILPVTVIGWFVVSSAIAILAQTLHERNWKG